MAGMENRGISMSDKKLPKFLTPKDFREHIVNWSDDTLRRRVQNDKMPAIQQENGRYLFPTEEVLLWFKRRQVRAG
jgi:hypothetical protein